MFQKAFPPMLFNESDGRQKSPMFYFIGREEELGGVLVGRADSLPEERFDAEEPTVGESPEAF